MAKLWRRICIIYFANTLLFADCFLNGISQRVQPQTRCISSRTSSITAQDVGQSTTTESAMWDRLWVPLAFEDCTDRKIPHHVTVLNKQLVLWYDPLKKAWNSVEDSCPHRLARLSEGRVDDEGRIQCPYHGWAFEGGTGTCTSIPQAPPEQVPGPRACARPYPTVLKQGIIWGWVGPQENVAPDELLIPRCSEIKGEAPTENVHRDLPYDYETLLENVIDVSHVPFTHHTTQGNRNRVQPTVVTLDEEVSAKGFVGTTGVTARAMRTTSKFVAPMLIQHTLTLPIGTLSVVAYAVPISPGKTRIFGRFPVNYDASLGWKIRFIRFLNGRKFKWRQHMFRNVVLDDDNIFLHHQERTLLEKTRDSNKSYEQTCYLPTTADTMVLSFRRWLRKHGENGPWGGLELEHRSYATKEELLDRYHQHTISCKPCSDALRRVTAAQPLLLFGASAAVTLSIATQRLPLTAVSALCILAWKKCNTWESLLRVGAYPPPRNRNK